MEGEFAMKNLYYSRLTKIETNLCSNVIWKLPNCSVTEQILWKKQK